jgi:hypothetical protein
LVCGLYDIGDERVVRIGYIAFGVSKLIGSNSHIGLKPGGICSFGSQRGPIWSAPTGNGCVGAVLRRGSCGIGRSSTGNTGSPVARSSRNSAPSVRIAASALRG